MLLAQESFFKRNGR